MRVFTEAQNEPNSNPIYEMPEMNVNKVLTKNYGKNSPGWLTKTNPKQTQLCVLIGLISSRPA